MKLIRLFFGLILLSGLFSCENDFDITADFQNIPVVFGLIDIGQEVNYFRIERAFIDQNQSALVLAQNPDSLYYGDNVQARLTNLRSGSTAILQRVNLVDEGFTREEGPFITDPNIGYRLNVADLGLEENDEVNFQLIGPNEQIFTEATTTVVGLHEIGSQPVDPIRFIVDRNLQFTLRSTEQAAVFYDLRLIFNYDEESLDNPGQREARSVVWTIEDGLERRNSSTGGLLTQTTFELEDGILFYQFLGANIEEDDRAIRTFTGIDLQFDAGGQDLFDYISIGQANTGITSSQIIPTFTNLSNDAVGVFSSRVTTRNMDPYGINTETRDSLREGSFTRQLNFN